MLFIFQRVIAAVAGSLGSPVFTLAWFLQLPTDLATSMPFRSATLVVASVLWFDDCCGSSGVRLRLGSRGKASSIFLGSSSTVNGFVVSSLVGAVAAVLRFRENNMLLALDLYALRTYDVGAERDI